MPKSSLKVIDGLSKILNDSDIISIKKRNVQLKFSKWTLCMIIEASPKVTPLILFIAAFIVFCFTPIIETIKRAKLDNPSYLNLDLLALLTKLYFSL